MPVPRPQRGHGRRSRDSDRVRAVFDASFAEAPDLVELTSAARRVLAVSAALFLERGAAATSVRDITRACGLSPGALYKHFASRDDVLYVLVCHGHFSLELRVDAEMALADDGPVARAAAFVRAYVTGHLVAPELAQVVRREYLHLSPDRYDEIVSRRRAMRDRLTRLLRAGVESGDFDLISTEHDTTRAALMLLDMCSNTSAWYDRGGEQQPPQLAELYVAAAMRLAGRRSNG